MKCLSCDNVMVECLIHLGTNVLWEKKNNEISLLTKEYEVLLPSECLGGSLASGHVCKTCNKVVVEYEYSE